MPDRLEKRVYSQELSGLVQDFYCGDHPWEREVAEWISNPETVLRAMRDPKRPCDVWLYFNEAGAVLGYGTLGKSRWRWPGPESRREWVYVIPWVGVRREYQGMPDGPPEDRYSSQVIDDLIFEANQRSDSLRLLGLFVHPQNERGKRFFRSAGFRPFHQTSRDEDTQTIYEGMILDLPRGLAD